MRQIISFEDARTYRFNPFDLTKVWPHADYPLIEAGKLALDSNLADFHTEVEQAACEPNNPVYGIGLSPDKMLLGRGFSSSDAHPARLGATLLEVDDAARGRLVDNIIGHLSSQNGGVKVCHGSGAIPRCSELVSIDSYAAAVIYLGGVSLLSTMR